MTMHLSYAIPMSHPALYSMSPQTPSTHCVVPTVSILWLHLVWANSVFFCLNKVDWLLMRFITMLLELVFILGKRTQAQLEPICCEQNVRVNPLVFAGMASMFIENPIECWVKIRRVVQRERTFRNIHNPLDFPDDPVLYVHIHHKQSVFQLSRTNVDDVFYFFFSAHKHIRIWLCDNFDFIHLMASSRPM